MLIVSQREKPTIESTRKLVWTMQMNLNKKNIEIILIGEAYFCPQFLTALNIFFPTKIISLERYCAVIPKT